METKMNIKTNGSNVWPYVIVGSAIGGAVGYLLMSESGRKIRRSVSHPDELADNLEDARHFIERRAQFVTDQVHGVLNKARVGIEEGQLAYRQAQQDFQSKFRRIEGKNNEVVAHVHRTVDNMSRTAVTIEQSVMNPISELGALYRGIERGIRAIFGRTEQTGPRITTTGSSRTPIYPDTRVMGG
jgi:hypothetical protein